MKLHMHPASTACHPVMMLASEEGIALDQHMLGDGRRFVRGDRVTIADDRRLAERQGLRHVVIRAAKEP